MKFYSVFQSEFVASHHPCHHDDGCTVPKPSSSGESTSKINVNNDWSPSEAQLFAQALEACGKNFGAIKKEFVSILNMIYLVIVTFLL